jgi:hypothetical protein
VGTIRAAFIDDEREWTKELRSVALVRHIVLVLVVVLVLERVCS